MADETEILFKIEIPSEGETQRTIEGITRASKELREERKKLNLDTAEGQKRIKEINAQLDQNNDLIKQNTSALEKQRLNVGNYKEDIVKAANETKLFGLSLNDVKESFLKLANPVTAGIALIGGLASAYVSSAAGARDLESAQTSLTANFKFLQNELAKLVGADGKGGGLLSALAYQFNLAIFGTEGATRGLIASIATNSLKELELAELDAQRIAKNALDSAEEQRRIRDNEKLSFQERLAAAQKVETFINDRETALVSVQEKKLAGLKELLAQDKDNLELQKQVKQVEFEIADIQEDSQGKRTEAVKGVETLSQALADQLALEQHIGEVQKLNFDEDQEAKKIQLDSIVSNNKAELASLATLDKARFDSTKAFEKNKKKEAEISQRVAALRIQGEQAVLDQTERTLAISTSLFKQSSIAYKAIAITLTIIDTVRGITRALSDYIFPYSLIVGALVGIAGTVQTAKIAGLQFARGGLLFNRIAQDGMIITGPSHAQGGVPFSVGGRVGFEAEGGEAIINKKSTAMYRKELSAINQAGGGVPFALGGIPGTTLNVSQTARQSEANAVNRDIVDTISKLKLFVAVTDINEGQRNVQVLEERATVIK